MGAQEILSLIENVDPADTAKLDEIDARVFCYYMESIKFIQMYESRSFPPFTEFIKETKSGEKYHEALFEDHKYTRSLDVLKAIRPVNVRFSIECFGWEKNEWVCWLPADDHNSFASPVLKTEELAELHAIIQAIEHERTKGETK